MILLEVVHGLVITLNLLLVNLTKHSFIEIIHNDFFYLQSITICFSLIITEKLLWARSVVII